jgi:hypothetical protein
MTSSSEILVLIANEKNATLCANTDGVTRLLRSIDRVLPANDARGDGENARSTQHMFACELMMALCRGMREHTYEGVVIFAEAPMMGELRRVQTSAVSRALIAEVVGKPSEISHFPGRSSANAQQAYRGAAH